MAEFVYAGGTIDVKTDFQSAGVPAGQAMGATDWGALRQASYDLRAAITAGLYHGFTKQSSRPAGLTSGARGFWVADDETLNYWDGTTDHDVLAGGGGGGGGYTTMTNNATDLTARSKLKVDGTLLHLADDGSSHTVLTAPGYTPTSTTLTPGTGLTGGGDLSANRTISLANTAVTPAAYTYAGFTVDQQGRITAAASGATPALASTTVSAGTGLSGGGDLSTNRTIALANTAVTPTSYTYASFTVDAQGRLTAASNGTTPALASVTISPGGDLTGGGDLSTSRTITLPNTLTSKTFAEGTASTFPAIVNKTGSAQAANHLLDFQRSGSSKHHFEFDASDVLHLFAASTDITSYTAALIDVKTSMSITVDANSQIPFTINNTHGTATEDSLIELERGGSSFGRIGLDTSNRLRLNAPGYNTGGNNDALSLGWGIVYKSANQSATIDVATLLYMKSGTNSGQTASTNVPHVLFDLTSTSTFAVGNIDTLSSFEIIPTTYAFAAAGGGEAGGAWKIANAATLYVPGPPVQGLHALFKNAWSAWFAGAARWSVSSTGSAVDISRPFLFETSTDAVNGTQSSSPPIVMRARGWDTGSGGSSKYCEFNQNVRPTQGNPVTAKLFWGAGFATEAADQCATPTDLMSLSDGGDFALLVGDATFAGDLIVTSNLSSAGLTSSGDTQLGGSGSALGFFASGPAVRPATTFTLHSGSSSFDLPSGATLPQVEQFVRKVAMTIGNWSGYGLIKTDL